MHSGDLKKGIKSKIVPDHLGIIQEHFYGRNITIAVHVVFCNLAFRVVDISVTHEIKRYTRPEQDFAILASKYHCKFAIKLMIIRNHINRPIYSLHVDRLV